MYITHMYVCVCDLVTLTGNRLFHSHKPIALKSIWPKYNLIHPAISCVTIIYKLLSEFVKWMKF